MFMPSIAYGNSQYYRWDGTGTGGSDSNTYLFHVRQYSNGKYVGSTIYVYCADETVRARQDVDYRLIKLEDAESIGINEAKANKLRAIAHGSYPNISLNDLKKAVGNVNSLTQAQAITATQYAIWNQTNNYSPTYFQLLNRNVKRVYEYLKSLPGIPAADHPADVGITNVAIGPNAEEDVEITFSYGADQTNYDGSYIELNHQYSIDLQGVYPGAEETVNTDKGIKKSKNNNSR